jgi:crotonobetainyl-CoA:carnitine CoA-transferase CaiB-like acyl-CoA transferase
MPGALIGPQRTGIEAQPQGNEHPTHVPHGVYRAAGDDRWLAIAVTNEAEWRVLCSAVPALGSLAGLTEAERQATRATIDVALSHWSRDRDAIEAMDALQAAGVPASASYTTNDLFGDAHLWEREFYKAVVERDGTHRFLPGLPWRWGDGALIQPTAAPAQGQHNQQILRDIQPS